MKLICKPLAKYRAGLSGLKNDGETIRGSAGWLGRLGLSRLLIGLISIACVGGMFAETEPNDVLAQADDVSPNGTATATIEPAQDVDWFRITVTESGRLTARIQSPPANMRPNISVYGRHAQWLGIYKSAINSGDDVHVVVDISEPGTYFFKVRDDNYNVSSGSYTFRSEFSAVPDANEPNNRVGRATLIDDPSMPGKIFPRGDEDWYRIHVTSGDELECELSVPSGMRGQITVYGADFEWLGAYSSAVNPGDTVFLNYKANMTGMFYLRVRDIDSLAHLDDYTLTVAGGTPGFVPVETPVTTEAEQNNSLRAANLINLSTDVTGTIGEAGDNDWFTFVPGEIGQVTIAMESYPDVLQLQMQLYNDSGSQLMNSQAGLPGGLFSMTYDVTSLERFYLRVRNIGDTTSASAYRFSSSIVPVADPFEPNDDYGDRALLETVNQVQGWIFPTSDSDWYEVRVTEAGEINAILSSLPENITPRISLYDLSRNHLTGRSGTPGVDLELSYAVGAAGSYLLEVSDARGNESTKPYTLTVLGAEFSLFAPVANIDLIDPGASVFGDTVSFDGSGTDTDGTVTGYSWRSSIDGQLSTQAAFTTSELSIGTHTIYFRVQDNDGVWSTEVKKLVYVGSTVSDEAEPNGKFFAANEIALNRPITAKIGEVHDEDYYKVYVPGAGRLVADLSNVPTNLRMELVFYNRYWDWIGVYNSATSAGDDVSLVYDVTEPGFVYLRARELSGNANDEFTYTLAVQFNAAPDEFEPNNQVLDAALLPESSVEGYFFPNGDEDWYKVWVPEGNTLEAEITSVPANVRADIYLYGRNREWLGRYESAVNHGDPVSASIDVSAAGYYFIRLRSADGFNWTDSYVLDVTGADPGFVPEDLPVTAEVEENNTISQGNMVAPGGVVNGSIQPKGDKDWFHFNVPAPGIVHVNLDNIPDAFRGRLRVYRDDVSQISSREASNPGDPLALDVRITVPGAYHVMVEDAGNNFESPELYALSVNLTTVLDANEPNNRLQESTPVTQQNRAQGYIYDTGDYDWYRVHSLEGSTLKAGLGDVPPSIRPQLEIYDHDGNRVAYKLASNDGQELMLSYAVTTTGDYSILVRDVGNDSFSTEPYTLVVYGAVFDSYVPLATIDSVTPNPAGADETVTFTGQGEDVDGSIIGYQWRSSIDGVFSISRVAEISELTPGTHRIYFKVKDDDQNWSPEVSTLLFFGVPAPAEIEPNNQAGSATAMMFDRQYTGSMDVAGDEDWFRIHVTKPGRLTINGSNPLGSPMRLNLTMYNPDVNWASVYETASNDGDPVTLKWNLNEPGYYYLRVRDNSNREGGEYTVSAALEVAPDPFENNNDYAYAAPVEPDDQLQAYIFPGNDVDYYKVTVPTPGYLQMSLTSIPADLRMEFSVYGRDLSWLGVYKTANNPGDDVFLTYDVPAAGTYFLRVKAAGGSAANPSATYTLGTQFTGAPDLFEPNPDFRSATWIEESPLRAYIFPGGDVDWYRVYAEPGGTLEFTADQVPENLKLKLTLYNADLGWMGVYNYAENEGDPVTLSYENAGGYFYLRVEERDNDRSWQQSYRLTVDGAQLDYQPPAEPQVAETEPNNNFSTADLIDTEPVTGNLGGDNDWYRFVVDEPSELTVSLDVSDKHRSLLKLYNANAAELASREAENRGDASGFKYPLTTPGVYCIRVSDADNSGSEDLYQLDLELVPVVDATEPNTGYENAFAVAFGDAINARIFPQNDHDWFLLEVTDPGTLVLDVTGVPSNLQMALRLYNQNFSQLLSAQAMHGGDPIHIKQDIREPGFYRVRLWDSGENDYAVAPYTFTAGFIPAEDGNEPNDRFRDAANLEARNQVQGLIHPGGDEDWFKFDVTEPGLLRVQIAQAGGIQPELRLFNDSNGHLVNMTARNKGEVLVLAYQINTPDTYYLQVRDDGNNDVSAEPYVVTIEGGAFQTYYPMVVMPPSFSPNPVLLQQPVVLSGSADDHDGNITSYEWSSDLDGLLGNTESVSISSLSEGRHRISLRARDDGGNWSARVDQYLIVASNLEHEVEYNNSAESALPIPLDEWTVGSIHTSGDQDYYRIYVDRCSRVEIFLDAVPPRMRGAIDVYSDDGGWLGLYTSAYNKGEWLDFSYYANPGWYLVRIRDLDNETLTGNYALRCSLKSGYDPYEPNASYAEATTISPNTVLADPVICPNGDEDWYRLLLEQPGQLTLELRNLPETMRGSISLYNEDLQWLGVYDTGINSGDWVPLTYEAPAPGYVYIRVRNDCSSPSPQPYELHSKFTPVVDPNEPNNQAGNATLLEEQSLQAYIFNRGDEDWYRIYLEADAALNLSLTEMPAQMRGQMTIYGPDMQWLGYYQTANNPGDNVFLSYTAPNAGMYFIRVRDDSNGSHVEPYRFTATGGNLGFEPPFSPQTSEVENNGSWSVATDIALDTGISGRLDPEKDNDYFRVWLNTSGILVVSHSSIPENITSEMWIYNANHDQLAYRRTTNPGEDNILEVAVTGRGYHYIRLRDHGQDNMSTAQYNLQAAFTPVVDPHEPNDSFGNATRLGESVVEGYLFNGSDSDWYRVYVRNPGTLSVSLDNVPEVNRPKLRLYDANGSEKKNWVNTNPGIGGDDLIVYDVPAQGFYYVRVVDEDGAYAGETYTLRITGADFSLAPLLEPIGDRAIDETISYAFTVFATDPDNPGNLLYSASNLPPGATFEPATRTFRWTPQRGQAGVYAGVHFEVSDGTFSDSEDITITVSVLSQAPVLEHIGDKLVQPETELKFQVNATDPDQGDTLDFAASNLPDNAVFDPETRLFTWTPSTNQIGVYPNIMFSVTDGVWTDFEYITIEVSEQLDPYENWLRNHFNEQERNNPDISGRDADPDADGVSNGDEYEADTNPRDADSFLRITGIMRDSNVIEIHWQGGVDADQYLERSLNLDGGPDGWTLLQTINAPTSVTNIFVDEDNTQTKAFYRIRVERP